MVYNSLPFGFKPSAFIYQSIGMSATSYCRSLGVPCLQYIDDRLGGSMFKNSVELKFEEDEFSLALRALYIICQVLIRLGYFINLKKSVFVPTTLLQFLGMLIDSIRLAFIIPDEKRKQVCSS